jgi:Dolichyl-phosphate-mannose-protein mannosyltransferase
LRAAGRDCTIIVLGRINLIRSFAPETGGFMSLDVRKALRPSLVLGGLTLLIHLLANAGYGIFRDELYFIVCGQRLAWGYVDQPPLVPMLAAWSYALSDGWLIGFRLIPALSLAATVALTAEFARAVGGGKFSQWLAGLCALCAPHFLAIGLLFTTDTFQPISWLACAFILLRLEQTRDERWWLAFGAVVGFSLLSKYMIAFYVVALAIGLLATPLRRSLARPRVYGGALLGLVIVLPNILWQQAHGWPFLELGKAAENGKNIALSPVAYFTQQLLLIGPLAAPVWLSGLWAASYRPRYQVFRAFPIAYVLLFAFFVVTHGKAYFLSSIYPILLPIGAVAIEGWIANRFARGAGLGLIAVASAVIAPLAIPLMPEETYIRYAAALGLGPSVSASEHLKQGRLPQHFADQHGWRAMAEKVAKVYWSLPPKDRARAVFFGNNYGEAAAIDVFGRRLGLPPAISGHNNYYLWGPRGHDGSVVIIIGGDPAHYASLFRSFSVAGRIDDPYAMPYETDKPIYVLRGMKVPLQKYWPNVKGYE